MTGAAKLPRNGIWLNAALAILVGIGFALSLGLGREEVPLGAAIADVLSDQPGVYALILLEVRLPRAVLAVLVGAALGLGGAVLQGLLRNPLADPGVIGVSASAGLGASLVFYTGIGAGLAVAVPLGGMAGALVAVLLILALAGRRGDALTLVLAGIAIGSLASALTALVLNLAPSWFAAVEIVFWLLGSLTDRSVEHVRIAAPLVLLGWVTLIGVGRGLDALTLGEETAQSVGLSVHALRLRVVLGVALSVGAVVSVSGGIGFVGLVVPHLIRPLVGYLPSRLLLPSALGGAVLVLLADIAVRFLGNGPELKLGVVTALVGAPFFLWLVLKTRREGS